jgi:hypothetical protein
MVDQLLERGAAPAPGGSRRIGPSAAEAVPDLVRALDDDDRYASAWAAIALRRVGTPEAATAVLDHLLATRWCATTTTTDSRY